MSKTVMFVDDDRRFIELYAEAAQEVGFEARTFHRVDDALRYLEEGGAADVIVWDMMLAPGAALAAADTQGGISTGRFLFRAMHDLRPRAVFILLTNLSAGDLEDADPRHRCRVLFKPDTPPEELAELLRRSLSEPRGEPGEGSPP